VRQDVERVQQANTPHNNHLQVAPVALSARFNLSLARQVVKHARLGNFAEWHLFRRPPERVLRVVMPRHRPLNAVHVLLALMRLHRPRDAPIARQERSSQVPVQVPASRAWRVHIAPAWALQQRLKPVSVDNTPM